MPLDPIPPNVLVRALGIAEPSVTALDFDEVFANLKRLDQLRSRSAVSNGLLHGLSEGWHASGQLQVTEHFREGDSHGLRTKWYSIGVKQSEAAIVDGRLHGPYRKWHAKGTLTEQVDFVADQPEGVSLSYFPSGSIKARVVMKHGKPVEQAFWRDGEKKE